MLKAATTTTTTKAEIIIIVECENLFIKQCGLKLMLGRRLKVCPLRFASPNDLLIFFMKNVS